LRYRKGIGINKFGADIMGCGEGCWSNVETVDVVPAPEFCQYLKIKNIDAAYQSSTNEIVLFPAFKRISPAVAFAH